MQITLNFGKTGLPLDLPEDWDIAVIRKKPMPVLPDAPPAVRRALELPVAAPPLSVEARNCRSACIVICDITHPVPNGLLRPRRLTNGKPKCRSRRCNSAAFNCSPPAFRRRIWR